MALTFKLEGSILIAFLAICVKENSIEFLFLHCLTLFVT